MSALRPVRGTRDFLPEDNRRRRLIEETALSLARRYGYGEITTPIFEFTEVFSRTLGDTSDIVTKEMYTFEDRSGERLTLRPENTAGVVRAFLTNNLEQSLPLKLFYAGPMFRYERPQKGRLRQFHQVGVELLGIAEPLADAEVIALGFDLLRTLGLKECVTVEINSLGDAESRSAYRAILVDYLEARRDQLSADSLNRLERNPLRILDSKDAGDRAVIAEAPLLSDSLTPAARDFFARVCDGLVALDIPFHVAPRLVRGLDYYTHTAFEFVTDALGAQGTVLAGGRYDGLIAQMGGRPTPGIGWAAGVERLMMLIQAPPPPPPPLAVVPFGPEQGVVALTIAARLRAAGETVECAFSGSLSKGMKWANRIGADVVIIVGPDELARDSVSVRDMKTGTQREVPLADLEQHLPRCH
jgi:histidyl-tRNA synthetase